MVWSLKKILLIKDQSTKIVNTILHDAEVTPDKTIDYIFGSGQLGLKSQSLLSELSLQPSLVKVEQIKMIL